MSTFNETNLIKKLENVTTSQDSIQTLSIWVLHHRNHYKKIVDRWIKCYIKAKHDHQLALFYLANDIVQHAKRKNLIHYLNEFMQALKEAAKVTDDKIMNNVNRVLNIWEERSVYNKEFIDELRELLCGEKIKAELVTKIVSEYSLNEVIKQITNVIQKEQMKVSKHQSLANCKLELANSDLLNKLKDKSYGEQFSKELDEAKKCLEESILAIETECEARKKLIACLEQSKVYYGIQMKECKNIAETFNNCELRLKQVQQRLHNNPTSFGKTPDISSSQLSSVLNFIQQQQQQQTNNSTQLSSLDQRLTSLMSGTGQFNLGLDHGLNFINQKTFNNMPVSNILLADNKKQDNTTAVAGGGNQIQSVISNRQYVPENTNNNNRNNNINPSENFEPADMDLGDSDDEFSTLHKAIPTALSSFISGQAAVEMASLLPLIQPPPPPPPPPQIPSFIQTNPNSIAVNNGKNDLHSHHINDTSSFRIPSIPSIVVDQTNFMQNESSTSSPTIRSQITTATSSSGRHHHRNHSSSHHHQSGWRKSAGGGGGGGDRYSNNRHGGRWKNGSGGGGSWKQRAHNDYY